MRIGTACARVTFGAPFPALRPAQPARPRGLIRAFNPAPQVRCASSFELLASLRTVRPLLDQLAASPGGLACLLLDNVAAYHWLDRAARGPRAGGQCDVPLQQGASQGLRALLRWLIVVGKPVVIGDALP